ncbi:MAG: replication initiator [Trebonia sp.]
MILRAGLRLPGHRDRPDGRRHRPARTARLLLGRHRLPARRHPPGRPAALGPAIATAAAVPLAPGPHPGPGAWETADDTASVTWADFLAAEHQLTATGGCQHPVRLRGRIDAIDLATGELAPVYDSGTVPGGVLLTACGNRRETVCPSCSAIYKRDARQLVRAGLVWCLVISR